MWNTKGKKELTLKILLEKISEYDIFKYYVGEFELGTAFNSPLREDNNPSFSIFNSDKGLRFKDFGTGQRGDCIEFVCLKFKCKYLEALNIISNDFDLGLHTMSFDGPTGNFIGVASGVNIPKKNKETSLRIKSRPWNDQEDKEYWSSYGIDCEVLNLFNVLPLSKFWINNYLFYTYNKDFPAYAYKFKEGLYKIMCPYSDYKWICNTKNYHYQGIEQIPASGDILIISKALKDVMIWYKMGIPAIAPQSENSGIDEVLMKNLKKRFKTILVCMDNDIAGKEASRKLCEAYSLKSIDIPEEDGIKDLGDYTKRYGISNSINLKNSILCKF